MSTHRNASPDRHLVREEQPDEQASSQAQPTFGFDKVTGKPGGTGAARPTAPNHSRISLTFANTSRVIASTADDKIIVYFARRSLS